MAAALQGFRLAVRSCNCRSITPICTAKSIGNGRGFSTTPQRFAEPSAKELEDRISKTQGSQGVADFKKVSEELADIESSATSFDEELRFKFNSRTPPFAEPVRRKKLKDTFMNMGEPEPFEDEGMLDDDHDDITTLAYGELELHRERRHYARLAAWEMPLLSSMCLYYGERCLKKLTDLICRAC